jgi:hypothetical protein
METAMAFSSRSRMAALRPCNRGSPQRTGERAFIGDAGDDFG